MKADITNRQELNVLLGKLTEDAKPEWGVMYPQNMVEHLAKTLQFSNGKLQLAQRTTDEEARKARESFLYTDAEMSRGIKSALLGEGPAPFEFPDLASAKEALNKELDDFETYFAGHPDATFIQPRLGALDHQGWVRFHNKHFTHHFKQFGLI